MIETIEVKLGATRAKGPTINRVRNQKGWRHYAIMNGTCKPTNSYKCADPKIVWNGPFELEEGKTYRFVGTFKMNYNQVKREEFITSEIVEDPTSPTLDNLFT